MQIFRSYTISHRFTILKLAFCLQNLMLDWQMPRLIANMWCCSTWFAVHLNKLITITTRSIYDVISKHHDSSSCITGSHLTTLDLALSQSQNNWYKTQSIGLTCIHAGHFPSTVWLPKLKLTWVEAAHKLIARWSNYQNWVPRPSLPIIFCLFLWRKGSMNNNPSVQGGHDKATQNQCLTIRSARGLVPVKTSWAKWWRTTLWELSSA